LNEDGVIQISDFSMNGFGTPEYHDEAEVDIGGFLGASLTPTAYIRGITRIVSPICGNNG
jgi:hypothetical protein